MKDTVLSDFLDVLAKFYKKHDLTHNDYVELVVFHAATIYYQLPEKDEENFLKFVAMNCKQQKTASTEFLKKADKKSLDLIK